MKRNHATLLLHAFGMHPCVIFSLKKKNIFATTLNARLGSPCGSLTTSPSRGLLLAYDNQAHQIVCLVVIQPGLRQDE